MHGPVNEYELQQRLTEILEKAIGDILQESVKFKKKSAISLAGSVAIRIREIVEDLEKGSIENNLFPEPVAPKIEASPPERFAGDRGEKVRDRGNRNLKSKEFPKFDVRSGTLVKTGWSKKSKSTYEHKIPHQIYSMIVALIAQRVAKDNSPFMAEEIIQASLSLDAPPPAYQIYLTLGFLVDRKILLKDGRRGYSELQDVEAAGENAWMSGGDNGR